MSEDLGKQVELQSQLNKLLQDRIKLQNQLNDACGKQCSQGEGMKKAAEDAGAAQQKNVAETEKLAQAQDKARKSQDKQSKSADGFFSSMSTGTAAGVGGIMGLVSGFKDMGISLSGAGNLLKSFTKSIFSVGAAIIAIPFKMFTGLIGMANSAAGAGTALRQAFEDVRKEFGSFAEGPGKNVIAGFKDMRSSAGDLGGTGLSVSRVFGYGPDGMAKMMGAVADIAKGLGPALNLLGDEFGKNAEKAVMFSKGLGLSGEQMGKLMKDAKLSGQSQSDMMTEVGSMSLQMAKKFGLSSKDIGKDIADMKGDFVSFGNMSTAQMGAASAYARKLGMDMKDLKGVVDKFDDFEGAADSVSQLNQAFGIQLDTMKMMNAENPAERIDMMRNAFHAAGKSIENMTRQEKKLLMAQTGLSESALKNAFAAENQGIAYEDFADAAGDAEENQLSQEEVMLKLAKAIEKIAEAGQSFSGIGDAFGKGFMRAMSKDKDMRALMRTIRKFLREVFNFGKGIGEVFMKIMKSTGMFKGLMDLFDPAKFRIFFKDIIKTVEKFADFLITGKGNPEDILQEFVDKISGFIGGKGKAMGQIGNAFLRLGEFLLVTLKVVGQFIWKKAKPYLMTAFNFVADYLSQNWKPIAMFIAKYVIAPMFVLAMIKGIAFAAGGALVKILAAKMLGIVLAAKSTAAAGAAAGAAAPAAGGFGAFVSAFAAIPWPVIGKAVVVLLALTGLFAVAVIAFSGAVALSARMLEKVSWGAIVKTFVVVGVAIMATTKLIGIGIGLAKLLPFMVGAGLGLVGAAVFFAVGVLAYSKAIDIVTKYTNKIDWVKFAEQLAGVGIAIGATAALFVAGAIAAFAGFGFVVAAAGLVAAATFFTVGVLAYSKGIQTVQEKAGDIKWKKFASTLGGVAVAVAATAGLFAAGAIMALGSLGFVVAAVGLKAGAIFFEGAITIFANAIKDSVPAFNIMYKNKKAVSFGLEALDKILVSITKLKKVAKSFGIMSAIFGGRFRKGIKSAGDFFVKTTPTLIKMIKAISKIKVRNKKSVKLQIEIVAAAVSAMQQFANMGIKATKLALVSKLLGGGSMTKIVNTMSKFILSIGVSLGIVIREITKLASSLPGGKQNNEKAKIVAQIIGAVAQLASGMMRPLQTVEKLGGSIFGPSVKETMKEVVDGVKEIILAIKDNLPPLVTEVLDLSKKVGDPKTQGPKMEVVAKAIGSIGTFSEGLGAAMENIPPDTGKIFSDSMKTRTARMMVATKSIVSQIKDHLAPLISSITSMPIGGSPEFVSKKIDVINSAMDAIVKFSQFMSRLKPYARKGNKSMHFWISAIAKDVIESIGPTEGYYDISDIFYYLKYFKPDEAQLAKLDMVVGVMRKVHTFANEAMKATNAVSWDSLKAGVVAMVESIRQVLGSVSLVSNLPNIKVDFKPLKALARVLNRISNTFKNYNASYFGPEGIIVKATTGIIESYNTTYEALHNLTAEPIDLKMRMADFADAMGVSRETFKIKNEQLNFTVNIKVDLDAEKMVDQLSDKKTMGKRTVQLAAGS